MDTDDNARVTVAVLKTELRHLDERARERHLEYVALWAAHKEDHDKHDEQFEKVCMRVGALETWQTEQKVTTGTMAKISAGVSAGFLMLGELVRWVISRASAAP